MKAKLFPILSLICCIIFAHSAQADSYNYISPEVIPPQFLTPPPKKDEFIALQTENVIKLQELATEQDIDAAKTESKLTPDLMDKNMDRKSFPKTYALLDKVHSDCDTIVHNAKNFYNTKRPYQTDKRIKLFIFPIISPSYPSGHTACSRVFAEVLSQLSPAKSEQWRNRADDIAGHRILAGVHWPQDVSAGKQLSLIFFGALQMVPAYQQDLKQAQQEWKN